MNFFSKIGLMFLLGGIVILNSTCTKQKWFHKKITYEGFVYDTIGGNPTSASVELRALNLGDTHDNYSTFSVKSTTTDASGHFSFNFKEAMTNSYMIKINGSVYTYKIGKEDFSKYKYIYAKHR